MLLDFDILEKIFWGDFIPWYLIYFGITLLLDLYCLFECLLHPWYNLYWLILYHDFILMATTLLSKVLWVMEPFKIFKSCFPIYSHINTFCSEFQGVYRYLEAPRLIPRLRPTSVTSFLCHGSLIFW